LALAAPHSGDWLHIIPTIAFSLLLEDNAIRLAAGVCIGCAISNSHPCPCSAMLDHLAWLKDFIHCALIRAEIPAAKELECLSRDDGKMSDGLTLLLWQSGRSTIWDVTGVHTSAGCHKVWHRHEAQWQPHQTKTAKFSNLSCSRFLSSGC